MANKANRGRRGFPQPRTVRRALDALQRMPREAVADLVERLVDRLDEGEVDTDLEAEEDCCPAGDDNPQLGGRLNGSGWLPGDDADAEPDDEDHGAAEDEGPIAHAIPPEPVKQIGVVPGHEHGVDDVWVAVR